jgi:HEAT repeat protein
MRFARRLVLGFPEDKDGPGLMRVLRRGDDAYRVRAARALALLPEAEAGQALLGLLDDPVPGVRRAAATGLGWRGDAAAAPALERRLQAERCTAPLVAAAAAWARCGGDAAAAGAAVGGRGAAPVRTARGWRSPEACVGFDEGTLQRELLQQLDPALVNDAAPDLSAVVPRPLEELRAALRRLLERDPHSDRGRQAIEALASLGHPEDLALLRGLRAEAGRRTINVLIIALGKLGDPRALPDLVADLDRMDVDPGRGFAYRRLVALSLGRMGVTSEAPRLIRALDVEARNYEGRPGAGLGIQFPVRSNLLWGLGELQAPKAARILIPYLSNLHGSALGGFHLPAMGALIKLGPPAVAPLVQAAGGDDEDAGVNAVGVLEAMGALEALEGVGRGRGVVAEAARAALAGDKPERALPPG